jgi:hypothetical protein
MNKHPFVPLIFRNPLFPTLPVMAMETIKASVLTVGVLTVGSARHQLTKRGWMSPSTGRRWCSGKFSTRVIAHLGLLVYCDAEFHVLFGSGLPWRW